MACGSGYAEIGCSACVYWACVIAACGDLDVPGEEDDLLFVGMRLPKVVLGDDQHRYSRACHVPSLERNRRAASWTWPWRPRAEGIGENEKLLVDDKPTKTCLELAVVSGDVEGEVRGGELGQVWQDRTLLLGVAHLLLCPVCSAWANDSPARSSSYRRTISSAVLACGTDHRLPVTDGTPIWSSAAGKPITSSGRPVPLRAVSQAEAVVERGVPRARVAIAEVPGDSRLDDHFRRAPHAHSCVAFRRGERKIVSAASVSSGGARLPAASGM